MVKLTIYAMKNELLHILYSLSKGEIKYNEASMMVIDAIKSSPCELSKNLKTELIKTLLNNEQIVDDKYFTSGDKVYTRRELAQEIEDETAIGVKIMTNMVVLAIDFTTRHTEKQ